jgi:hypothetical protein
VRGGRHAVDRVSGRAVHCDVQRNVNSVIVWLLLLVSVVSTNRVDVFNIVHNFCSLLLFDKQPTTLSLSTALFTSHQ